MHNWRWDGFFVCEWADLFDPIKKVNLNIGLKKTKEIRKAVSIIKEDRQAFGGNVRERSEPRGGVRISILDS